MNTDKDIIDIDDTPEEDDRPQDVPEFILEERANQRDEVNKITITSRPKKRHSVLIGILITVVIALIILLASVLLYHRVYPTDFDLKASVKDNQNIEYLDNPPSDFRNGTVVTRDSVLGVAFDMYSLAGLRASLETEIPDTTDSTLVLFMRSADYNPDGSIEGTFVIDGDRRKAKSRPFRTGYVALSADGKAVIGISQNDKVAERMVKTGGSFFRQYPLLGDGQLPQNFYLRGKVERGAIGRMNDGNLYYILTRHKETLYDFADALREYGFMDAIYITGGNFYNFHRNPEGRAHVSEKLKEKIHKYTSESLPVPLLVFRTGE